MFCAIRSSISLVRQGKSLARIVVAKRVCKASRVVLIADGRYDVMVIDARQDDDGVHLELAISSGERRGDVVSIVSSTLTRSWLDVLGTPATLIVVGGLPRVEFD